MEKRGGLRKGAGRTQGSGAFKEPTVVKRIPQSLTKQLDVWLSDYKLTLQAMPPGSMLIDANAPRVQIPVASDSVRAGFPSPAAPYVADYLDFNQYLVSNPSATIAIYAKGDSMNLAGITSGDMLVVNRALEAQNGDIVVAEVDGDFTVKRLVKTSFGIELHAESDSPNHANIIPNSDTVINLVGVVQHVIKSMR